MPRHNPVLDGFSEHDLVYLDNAASTQKPKCVVDEMSRFYLDTYSNINRGSYSLAHKNSQIYEQARQVIKDFCKASNYFAVFTGGTTDSINMISTMLAHRRCHKTVIISDHEHHSNILPWRDFKILILPHDAIADVRAPDVISVSHCCNVTGQIFDVENIIKATPDATHIIDGAQFVPHRELNLDAMNPEFYVFSCHKMYGPTGLGVMFIRKDIANDLCPPRMGGGMVQSVEFVPTDSGHSLAYQTLDAPEKFEAGTPPIAQVIGMKRAIEYLVDRGSDKGEAVDLPLRDYLLAELTGLEHVQIIGRPDIASISFVVKGMHPHDVASFMDESGIAIRVGHMCAQPTLDKYGYSSACRVSCALYTTQEELKSCVDVVKYLERYSHV